MKQFLLQFVLQLPLSLGTLLVLSSWLMGWLDPDYVLTKRENMWRRVGYGLLVLTPLNSMILFYRELGGDEMKATALFIPAISAAANGTVFGLLVFMLLFAFPRIRALRTYKNEAAVAEGRLNRVLGGLEVLVEGRPVDEELLAEARNALLIARWANNLLEEEAPGEEAPEAEFLLHRQVYKDLRLSALLNFSDRVQE